MVVCVARVRGLLLCVLLTGRAAARDSLTQDDLFELDRGFSFGASGRQRALSSRGAPRVSVRHSALPPTQGHGE